MENFSASRADLSTVACMASTGGARRVPPHVVRALARGRALTRELAADLLTHTPDMGHEVGQRELDAWVDQAADTLLALSDALEARLLELGTAPAADDRTAVPR